jgi:hypothetical protein
VHFWRGYQGPDHWRWGPLSDDEQALWDASNRSFAVLAGIQWTKTVDGIAEAGKAIGPGRFKTVRYEDFTADPQGVTRDILDWASVPWTPVFERRLAAFDISSRNDRWATNLSSAERDALVRALGPALARHGYAAEPSAATPKPR